MKSYINLILFSLLGLMLQAQPQNTNLGDIQVPTPEVAALAKYAEIPVSHFTGVPSISIPIHTLQEGPLSLPISINYHASGIRAGEIASWVGLGWSLNAGGVISRTVLGLPDEGQKGFLNDNSDLTNFSVLDQISSGQIDGEPDLFTFSFPGGSGKFIIQKDGNNFEFIQFPHTDIKIELVESNNSLIEFILTTPDGTRYIFGGSEAYYGYNLVEQGGGIQAAGPQASLRSSSSSSNRQRTEWYLKRIESHDLNYQINFTYHDTKEYAMLHPATQTYAQVLSNYSVSGGGGILGLEIDAGFGNNGVIESPGSFQISSQDNRVPNNQFIYGSLQKVETKLIKEITTSTTKVSFVEDPNQKRKDMDIVPYQNSLVTDVENAVGNDNRRLKEILVQPLTQNKFGKKFELTHSYFQSFDNPIYTFDYRLKLDEIKETSTIDAAEIPAYVFEYHNQAGKAYPFIPWRLTKAVDAWGYYNGAESNNMEKFNFPPTSLSISHLGNTSTVSKGAANRDSDETYMKIGALRKITYPEGGSTEFNLEANEIDELAYTTDLQLPQPCPIGYENPACPAVDDELKACLTGFSMTSCDAFIDAPNVNEELCCPDASKTNPYTVTEDFIEFGWLKIELELPTEFEIANSALCVDDPGDTNQSEKNGKVQFIIRNQSTGQDVDGMIEYNEDRDQEFLVKVKDRFPNLLPGTYDFIISSAFAKGTVTVMEEKRTITATTKEVGGLRINNLTTYNHNGDQLRQKFYSYEDFTEGCSSGLLYVTPKFGHIISSDQLSYGVASNTFYVKFNFVSAPIVPLSDIQGYHIGYANVREFEANGAYTDYAFTTRSAEGILNSTASYPLAPLTYFYDNGSLENSKSGSNSKVVAENDPIGGAISIYNANHKEAIRLDKTAGQNNTLYIPNKFKYDLTGFYRVYAQINIQDGVESRQDFFYQPINSNSNHLNPIQTSFINSDGTEYTTTTKYAHEAAESLSFPFNDPIYNDMVDRNMIGIPIEQISTVNGTQVAGNRTLFKAFNGHPYPEEFYNYEYSWNENGTAYNNGWKLEGTVTNYTNKGKPTGFSQRGWQEETYEWHPVHNLITKREFEDFTWNYTYHDGTRLIETITDVDGQEIDYDYDGLMRLNKIEARNNNVTTTYDYKYIGQDATRSNWNYVKTNVTFGAINEIESSLQSRTSFQFLDGIGRPVQNLELAYTEDGHDQIVYQEYDAYGRLVKVSEPFSSGTSLGLPVDINNFSPYYTTTDYFDDPLNRPKSVKAPNWLFPTTYEYRGNVSADNVNNYSAENQLAVSIVRDPNQNKLISFTDKRGRLILERREEQDNPAKSSLLHIDIYREYDLKDRLTMIIPPGASNSSSDLIYTYVYDGRDNLLRKKIPDQDGYHRYWYDERRLMTYSQDPQMALDSRAIRTEFDVYGRPLKTGFIANVPSSNGNIVLSFSEELTRNTYYPATANVQVGQRSKLESSFVKILDGSGNELFSTNSYDIHGRVVSTTGNNHLNLSSGSMTTSIKYDFADNVIVSTRSQSIGTGPDLDIEERTFIDHSGRVTKKTHSINDATPVVVCEMGYTVKDELRQKKLGVNGANVLQEVNYAYNAQGWLRTINSPLFNLDIRYADPNLTSGAISFNGNISELNWSTPTEGAQSYRYYYDYLDRLLLAQYEDGNDTYTSSYSYDSRGNLSNLTRKGQYWDGSAWQTDLIDNLVYGYVNNGGRNRLNTVIDGVQNAMAKIQGFNPGSGTGSYGYDVNGNMITDPYKELDVLYNHLNQPTTVDQQNGNEQITWLYDAAGNKLSKTVVSQASNASNTLSGAIASGDYYGVDIQADGTVQSGSLVNLYANNSVTLTAGFEAQAGSNFLARIQSSNPPLQSTTRDYLAGVEYMDGVLEQIAHPEGRVFFENGSSTGQYEYVLKDHLGNSRIVFHDLNANGIITNNEIKQEHHYYAFGMEMQGTWQNNPSGKHRYTYNGKELNEELGLDWLSYGAREYDPAIGRFFGVDPIAEDYAYATTYNYAENEPVGHIDLWGLQKAKKSTLDWLQSANGGASINTYNSYVRIQYHNRIKKLKPLYSSDELTPEHVGGVITRTADKEYSRSKLAGPRSHLDHVDPITPKFQSGKQMVVDGYYGPELVNKPNPKFFKSNTLITNGARVSLVVGGLSLVLSTLDLIEAHKEDRLLEQSQIEAGKLSGAYIGMKFGAAAVASPFNPLTKTPLTAVVTVGAFSAAGSILGESGIRWLQENTGPPPRTGMGHTTCFVAGTKILMADGSEKNIELIREGELILGVDTNLMEIKVDTVKLIPKVISTYRKIQLILSNKEKIEFSPAHPFWVVGKGWAVFDLEEAKTELTFTVNQMEIGDKVLIFKNGQLKELEILSLTDTGTYVKMYNLENVAMYHSFFANRVLVHNKKL